MNLSLFDISFFVLFFAIVVGISMYKSRRERSGEDFFLAGRSLTWPFIGLSLIAANISTEQIVGQAGQGAGNVGLAVASYEWIAAITMVVVALFFLPRFLKSGIYTMPEYLEYRYSRASRSVMALYTIAIYVGVTISAVIYSGALTLNKVFGVGLVKSVWLIGIIAAVYTTWGGLKAVAWADLFQGSALILGGIVTTVVGFIAVGGVGKFFAVNADKLHMVLPASHPVIPWTALVVGLWIPNFYYWGLNQYITQRTLASKTLKQGQMGIIFAAGIKLLLPFIIVLPGIMSFQLFKSELAGNADSAYPLLIKYLIPVGIKGFIFAALAGAVISSLASMLNSAATIFTMDIFKRYAKNDLPPQKVVAIGRATTLVLMVIGCLIAPQLGNPRFQGIFNYIQEFQGFVSPGILAAFVFGMVVKKAPAKAGLAALVSSPLIYGVLLLTNGGMAFLNRMAVTFFIILAIMTVMTLMFPLRAAKVMPVKAGFDLRTDASVVRIGLLVIAVTIGLYILFW
jgi:SSS family solute:Na+ symporter